MILKIYDDNGKVLGVYARRKWIGVRKEIIAEIAQASFMALNNRSELFFHKLMENLPETAPEGRKTDFVENSNPG